MSRWIVGVLDPHGRIDRHRLRRALAPDAAGLFEQDPVLGVAYTGASPPAGEILCLFDGHLDNRAQLLEQLGESDSAALSDETLLARAYTRWGNDLPAHLLGDFALLIWDRARGSGLLARDQLGVRPLYLYERDGRALFAGEVRHLLALLDRTPAPDAAGVAHWIALSNRPGPQTLYAGIRRLEPGTALLLERAGTRVVRYWSPRYRQPLDELSPHDLSERARISLRTAVARKLDGDNATGVLMSGGLDSSSVAAIASELARGRVLACSATFPEHPATDEAELIATLSRELSLPTIGASVRPGGLLASMLESLAAWRMPPIGWGDFWTLPLMRAAASYGVTTMLDGDGGDQVFGPRTYLMADQLRSGHPFRAWRLARSLPGAASRPPRRAIARVFRDSGLSGALPYRAHGVLSAISGVRATPRWLRPPTRRALNASADVNAWKQLDGPRWWAFEAYVLARGIDEVGVFEHQRRRAALAGLEARHPLLDLDLVELGLRQPPRATLNPLHSRPVLRAAMDGLLPDVVRLRPEKARFESLISDCLRETDGAAVRALLTDRDAEIGAYVETSEMRRALFDTGHGASGGTFHWMWQVWRLLTIECWLRMQSGRRPQTSVPLLSTSEARVDLAMPEARLTSP